MPNYTFKCSCGKEIERNTPISVRIIKCPDCGGFLERQFPMTAGAIFRGKGFYETDYKEKK